MKKNFSSISLTAVLAVALFLAFYSVDAWSRRPLSAKVSAPQQSTSKALIGTPTLDPVIAATQTPTPFGRVGNPLASPTPINVAALPTLQPGLGRAFGRILCDGVPAKHYTVYVVMIDGDSYWTVQAGYTDENGRWFLIRDVHPGTYTVMNDLPKYFGRPLWGRWTIEADQITDFGDINLPASSCP